MNKKIAMLIAFRDFQDEEYFISKGIFEENGIEISTASDSLGIAIGKSGGEAEVDLLISDLKIDDYDAILFVGGPGASKYIDNETAHRVAKEAFEKNKVLGAICIAPAILAKAGILKGKKATVWSSVMDKFAVKILKESGANYQNETLVIDGKIITASGPLFAEDFAKAIISVL